MPKQSFSYNADRGEWFPYNTAPINYSDRARSMFFFKSMESAPSPAPNLTLSMVSDEQTVQPSPGIDSSKLSYPFSSSHSTGYSDGTFIYRFTCVNRSQVSITLNKPASGNSDDQEIYEEYRRDLDFLLRDYFVGFSFNTMELTAAPDFLLFNPDHVTNVSNVTTNENDVIFTISLDLDTPFPDTDSAGNTVPDSFTVENSTLNWKPQFTEYTIDGNFILCSSPVITDNAPVNSYITVQDSSDTFLGNYFVEERFNLLVAGTINFAVKVKNLNSFDFPVNTSFTGSVQMITVKPRLRVKYTLPIDPPAGNTTYKFYTTGNYSWSSAAHDNNNLEAADDSYSSLITDDGDTQSLIQSHQISFNGGVQGRFPISLNTDLADTGIRTAPWRKAYRFLSRFKPKNVHVYFTTPDDGTRSSRFDLFSTNPRPDGIGTIPSAISHKPPCYSPPDTENRKGLAIISFDPVFNSTVDGDFTGPINWPGGSGATHYYSLEGEGEGLNFEENTTPGTIRFKALTTGGVVDCRRTVTPAYSGEILYWDSSNGFIKNNHTLPSAGVVNTVVFIDITETDEVLRWRGSESSYIPGDFWRSKISRVTIHNGTDTIELNDYEIIKTDKDNYVVAMYSTSDQIIISDDNDVQVTMVGRQVIQNWNQPLQPDNPSCSYGPLQYRTLEEELQDDIRDEDPDPRIGVSFTIVSDKLVDGKINITQTNLEAGTSYSLHIEADPDAEGYPG